MRVVAALEKEKISKLTVGIPDTNYREVVDLKEKEYFEAIKDLDFPELVDQGYAILDGEIVSFSKRKKQIGFLYKNKILQCRPVEGKKVVDFIEFAIVSRIRISGTVHRPDKEKLPIIYIKKVEYIQQHLIK
jgi:hypothetical protein